MSLLNLSELWDMIISYINNKVGTETKQYCVNQSSTEAPAKDDPKWTDTMPTVGANDYLWVRNKVTYGEDQVMYEDAYMVSGQDGYSSNTISLYKWDDSEPSLPFDFPTVNYNFKTNSISLTDGNPYDVSVWGWAYVMPQNIENKANLYQITYLAYSRLSSVEIKRSDWTVPRSISMKGTPGESGKSSITLYLYRRSDKDLTGSDLPANNLLYSFKEDYLSGDTGSWAKNIPSGEAPLYVTTVRVTGLPTETVTIMKNTWSTPVVLSQNSYTYIRYSNYATGRDEDNNISMFPKSAGLAYMGIAHNATGIAPTEPEDYTWSKVQGDDGVGIESIVNFYVCLNETDKPADPTKLKDITLEKLKSFNSKNGWVDNIPEWDSAKPYTWNYEAVFYTDGKIVCTEPAVTGTLGKGIKSITEYYLASEYNTEQEAFPSWNALNDTTKADPLGVDENNKKYGWTKERQVTDSTVRYLWNFERIVYSDGEVQDMPEAIIGTEGKSIKVTSSNVYYRASSSGTVNPDSQIKDGSGNTYENKDNILGPSGNVYWVDTIAKTNYSKGSYVWSKTIVKYSDSTYSVAYNTSYIATDGAPGIDGKDGLQGPKGDQGIPGKDGVDGKATYFHIKYSEVEKPTSSAQLTEVPSKYIGTYVDNESADSVDPTKYTWSKFSGEDGKDGINGTNGKDGETYYLHFAYANSSDGSKDFTVTYKDNMLYMGHLTDKNKSDSTNYKDYTWTKIKGDQGDQGIPGKDGADGTSVTISSSSVTYQVSNSGTTTPTGTWNTSVPTVNNGQYLWTRTVVNYSDGKSTTSYSVSYKGTNGSDGTNVTIKSTEIRYQASSSGTTTPTGTWSASVPNLDNGQYLWTRTVVNYNPSGSTTSYSVSYKGTNGTDGEKGDTGNGISSITYTYAVSTTTTAPSSITSTSIPSTWNTTNKYLWQREDILFTDGTHKYTNVMIGVYGATGPAGKDGTDGLNSVTLKIYLAGKYDTTPSKPSSDTYYTFSTDTWTGNGNWKRDPKEALTDEVVYVSSANVSGRTDKVLISKDSWSTPVIDSTILKTATITLYKVVNDNDSTAYNGDDLILPSNVSFDMYKSKIITTDLKGWSEQMPQLNEVYSSIFMITTTVSSNERKVVVNDWSIPVAVLSSDRQANKYKGIQVNTNPELAAGEFYLQINNNYPKIIYCDETTGENNELTSLGNGHDDMFVTILNDVTCNKSKTYDNYRQIIEASDSPLSRYIDNYRDGIVTESVIAEKIKSNQITSIGVIEESKETLTDDNGNVHNFLDYGFQITPKYLRIGSVEAKNMFVNGIEAHNASIHGNLTADNNGDVIVKTITGSKDTTINVTVPNNYYNLAKKITVDQIGTDNYSNIMPTATYGTTQYKGIFSSTGKSSIIHSGLENITSWSTLNGTAYSESYKASVFTKHYRHYVQFTYEVTPLLDGVLKTRFQFNAWGNWQTNYLTIKQGDTALASSSGWYDGGIKAYFGSSSDNTDYLTANVKARTKYTVSLYLYYKKDARNSSNGVIYNAELFVDTPINGSVTKGHIYGVNTNNYTANVTDLGVFNSWRNLNTRFIVSNIFDSANECWISDSELLDLIETEYGTDIISGSANIKTGGYLKYYEEDSSDRITINSTNYRIIKAKTNNNKIQTFSAFGHTFNRGHYSNIKDVEILYEQYSPVPNGLLCKNITPNGEGLNLGSNNSKWDTVFADRISGVWGSNPNTDGSFGSSVYSFADMGINLTSSPSFATIDHDGVEYTAAYLNDNNSNKTLEDFASQITLSYTGGGGSNSDDCNYEDTDNESLFLPTIIAQTSGKFHFYLRMDYKNDSKISDYWPKTSYITLYINDVAVKTMSDYGSWVGFGENSRTAYEIDVTAGDKISFTKSIKWPRVVDGISNRQCYIYKPGITDKLNDVVLVPRDNSLSSIAIGKIYDYLDSSETQYTNWTQNDTTLRSADFAKNMSLPGGVISEGKPAVVIYSFRGQSSWCRLWSDGYLEQGGTVHWTANTYPIPVTMPREYSLVDYDIVLSAADENPWDGSVVSSYVPDSVTNTNYVKYKRTTRMFYIYRTNGSSNYPVGFTTWRTSGWTTNLSVEE